MAKPDHNYFENKLSLILRDLRHYNSDELARELARLVVVADESVLSEKEFTKLNGEVATLKASVNLLVEELTNVVTSAVDPSTRFATEKDCEQLTERYRAVIKTIKGVTTEYSGLQELRNALSQEAPDSAGAYVKTFFKKRGLNALQASKVLGCSSSTLTRLFSGSALTVDMASKLEKHYGIDSKLLFSIEANCNAFKAKHKLVT